MSSLNEGDGVSHFVDGDQWGKGVLIADTNDLRNRDEIRLVRREEH